MLKKLKVLIIVLLLILGMTLLSLGQGILIAQKTNPDVWINVAKVIYQNKDITDQLSPIIINGTTYLPMAKSAELFDKDISWEDTTKTITLKDKAVGQDRTTKRLEKEVATLNDKLMKARLDKVGYILNSKYNPYYGMKLKISLVFQAVEEDNKSGNITVKIDASEKEWKNIMTLAEEKAIVKKIYEDIIDEFGKLPISGEVKDGKKIILKFEVDSKGLIRVRTDSMYDLEDLLNKSLYANKLGELRYINNKDLNIEVTGDSKDFIFYIRIHLKNYNKQWDQLNQNEIEEFLYNTYNNILLKKEYKDSEIEGYFYDVDNNTRLVKCYRYNGGIGFTYY